MKPSFYPISRHQETAATNTAQHLLHETEKIMQNSRITTDFTRKSVSNSSSKWPNSIQPPSPRSSADPQAPLVLSRRSQLARLAVCRTARGEGWSNLRLVPDPAVGRPFGATDHWTTAVPTVAVHVLSAVRNDDGKCVQKSVRT